MFDNDPSLATKVAYYATALTLGALASFSALLGSPDKQITIRGAFAYVLTGGLCSLMIVLLLVEKYGPSELLIGVSILAGYQAFNMFFVLGVAMSGMAKRILGGINKS